MKIEEVVMDVEREWLLIEEGQAVEKKCGGGETPRVNDERGRNTARECENITRKLIKR